MAFRRTCKLAVLLLAASTTAMAQTITSPPASSTTAPSPTMTVECWYTTSFSDGPASIPVAPTDAAAFGALCWEVYATGGGTAMVPVTVTDPDFAPTAVSSVTSALPSAVPVGDVSSNTTPSSAAKVLAPAIIGSLVGAVVLLVGVMWFVRARARRQQGNSRARRWADQRGSWQMSEGKSTPSNLEDGFSAKEIQGPQPAHISPAAT